MSVGLVGVQLVLASLHSIYLHLTVEELKQDPVFVSEKISKIVGFEMQQITQAGGGVILHNIPEEMTVQDTEIVQVRIARTLTTELTQRLEGNADPEIKSIRVAPRMSINLAGSREHFDIELINPTEEKTVGIDRFTEWFHNVKPLASGTPDIYLNASVFLESEGRTQKYDLPLTKKTVLVHSNPPGAIINFLRTNWHTILTLMLGIGMVGWLSNRARKWRARKNDKAKDWERL